nr:MAG TPA: hypothetical protein [Caudoviricetes sp.]DAK51137.1 MAG TPA: hypothetical protein [Caudoviricetes sp.]DAS07619.1 MAG TPA: hypothetical protein [Bacteriophage sp.]
MPRILTGFRRLDGVGHRLDGVRVGKNPFKNIV